MDVARERMRHQESESCNLKISKVLPKCGSKTLIISMGGGNMPMKVMNRIIIAHENNIINDAMQDRSMLRLIVELESEHVHLRIEQSS